MPSPTSAVATLRPDLGGSLMEYDLQASHMGFVHTRIFPVFEAASQSGVFGRIPLAQLLQQRQTERAPGAGYSRGNWNFTPVTYACVEHGAEEPVDDRQSKMYREYFDAELVAAMRARDAVLRNMEADVIAKVTDTGVWAGAALTTGVSNAWSSPSSATPVTDVSAAAEKVYENSGLIANAVIMSHKKFSQLRNCNQVLDRIKYSGRDDPKRKGISAQMIADLFDVEEVIIAGSQRNSAKEGQAAVLAAIWPDARVMVCRVARRIQDIQEPCIGRTLHWGEDGSEIGAMIESYRDETVRGDVIRARMDADNKRLYVEAGHLLTGT
ncbi:MAG: hypothetical protein KF847_19685 [Pirellulales bacterium]|nr:hypothetical protein [Pirellulales bacterium]